MNKPIEHVSWWTNFKAVLNSKLPLKRGVRVRGYEAYFDIDNPIEYWRVANAEGERAVLNDFLGRVHSDDVFWDIGANIGVWSCLAAKRIVTGEIVAFEPYGPNRRKLQDNLDANGGAASYTVLSNALSDSGGMTDLHIVGDSTGEGRHSLHSDGRSERTQKVSTVTGDAILRMSKLEQPTVVKIDVEGAEPAVIRGMHDTLEHVRLVYLETHEEKGSDEDPVEMLEDMGFKRVGLVNDRWDTSHSVLKRF